MSVRFRSGAPPLTMGGMTFRICPRVADLFERPGPDISRGSCFRCGQVVIHDPVPPPGHEDALLVCDRCVTSDPDLRAGTDRGFLIQAEAVHAVIDRFRAEHGNLAGAASSTG
jgi:hypothetical protein